MRYLWLAWILVACSEHEQSLSYVAVKHAAERGTRPAYQANGWQVPAKPVWHDASRRQG